MERDGSVFALSDRGTLDMDINLIFEDSVSEAPAGFIHAMHVAAHDLDRLLIDPITVNIQVGYGDIDGTALPPRVSEGGTTLEAVVDYRELKRDMSAAAGSPGLQEAVDALPATNPFAPDKFAISSAEQKAWGLLDPRDGALDGYVGISKTPDYAFSRNDITPQKFDLIGLAEHELTHALGRDAGLDSRYHAALDLFRYAAPNVREVESGQPAYLSLDHGATDLNDFDLSSAADWAASARHDAFDEVGHSGFENRFTQADRFEMNAAGFNTRG